jgi:hypothetical protein
MPRCLIIIYKYYGSNRRLFLYGLAEDSIRISFVLSIVTNFCPCLPLYLPPLKKTKQSNFMLLQLGPAKKIWRSSRTLRASRFERKKVRKQE